MNKHNNIHWLYWSVHAFLLGIMLTVMLQGSRHAHASSWDPGLLVNTEAFQIIDDSASSADIELIFGDTVDERFLWDRALEHFTLTDDIVVQGNIDGSGTLDITGDTTIDTDTFHVDATANTVGVKTTNPEEELEVVGTASGTHIHAEQELTSSGLLIIDRAENSELIRLTDETNTDTVGIYTGNASPEGVVSAQLGSIYIDHATGTLYKKNAEDGANTGWAEIATSTGAYAARMTQDAVWGIPTSTWTKMPFDNEDFDIGNIADATTNDRFNIKMDGRYYVTADWGIMNLDTDDWVAVAIDLNGTLIAGNRDVSPSNDKEISVAVSEILDLNAGDTLEMYVYHTDNGNRNTNTGIYKPRMSVGLLAPSGVAGTGISIEDADDRYVSKQGDTMTGNLIIENNAGLTASGALQTENNVTINKDNAAQDAVLTFGNDLGAETLRFSDTNNVFEFSDDLTVQGAFSGASITISNLLDCDSIDTDTTGNLSCGPKHANTVTVATSGADYTSIKDAVDSITDASASKKYIVYVYPGIYIESPITMKEHVDILSVAGAIKTTIVASNASSDLVTTASGTLLRGFSLSGVTSGACISATGDNNASVRNVILASCEVGMKAEGSGVTLAVQEGYHFKGTMTSAAHVHSGALLQVTDFYFTSDALTNGVYVTGSGSRARMQGVRVTGATNGVYINGPWATVTMHNAGLRENTNALRIGTAGTGSVLQLIGGAVHDSTTYDGLVENAKGELIVSSALLDRNKVSFPALSEPTLSFIDQQEDDEGNVILGELSIGSPEIPSEAVFGEGDSYTKDMLVYTETPSSTFANVSTSAASATGSTFTFPGTAADNAIYISTDRKNSAGNITHFFGYKLKMAATALTLGAGEVIHEYWNGSAWTTFSVMCSHASLFHRYADDCFLRPSVSEHVRFNAYILDDWATNDPPSTGTNRYWVRIRVDSAITTAPVFEQFKVHTNRTEINGNGTITSHGDARYYRKFVVSPDTIFYGQGGNAPDNRSHTVGTSPTSWSDERYRAAFNGGSTLEEVTGSISLPYGLDTSTPLTARIAWKKQNNNSGNVEWKLDYLVREVIGVPVANGSSIEPVARTSGEHINADAGTTIQTVATGSAQDADEIIRSEFTTKIDISGYYEGDVLFARLYRDPSDSDDTYGSDATLIGFELNGAFWTPGDKLR